MACVKKYLVDASLTRGLNFLIKTRIIANMFISKPIQIINPCELIITTVVPEMIVK